MKSWKLCLSVLKTMVFVLFVGFLATACGDDTASTADTVDDSDEETALDTSNMSLSASTLTLTPGTETLTVAGAEGSVTDEEGNDVDCTGATVELTIGEESGTATMAADCSFEVSATSGGSATATLAVIGSSGASSETGTSYEFTIPSEASSLEDAVLADNEVLPFLVADASTAYTVCPVAAGATECASATDEGCFTATSDANSIIWILVESGETFQVLTTDSDTGEASCDTLSLPSEDEQTEAETDLSEADAEYDANDETEVTVSALALDPLSLMAEPMNVTGTLGFTINVNLTLKAIMPSGQEQMPPCPASPCRGNTVAYKSISTITDEEAFLTDAESTSGGVFSAIPGPLTTTAKVVNYEGSCELTDYLTDPESELTYDVYATRVTNYNVFKDGYLLNISGSMHVEIVPAWTQWMFYAAVCGASVDYNPNLVVEQLFSDASMYRLPSGQRPIFIGTVPLNEFGEGTLTKVRYVPDQSDPSGYVSGSLRTTITVSYGEE